MNKPQYFAHPSAIVEAAEIGPDTRIWAFVHVLNGAVIGAECNIGDGCFIEGGAVLGNAVTVKNGVAIWDGVHLANGVFVGPNVAFTNDARPRSPRLACVREWYTKREWLLETRVQEGASIGANATICCGINIGCWALIGAGAVVTRDIPPHALVLGNPARLRGYVCVCGCDLALAERAAECSTCGRKYQLDKAGLIKESPRW